MSRTARYSFMGTRGGSGHAALPCISARFVSVPLRCRALLQRRGPPLRDEGVGRHGVYASTTSLSCFAMRALTTCLAGITARADASGRRAHHRCSVDGCPWRIDFSRADAALIASSGNATSISFFLITGTFRETPKDRRLPFAGPAVVVAAHAPQIRTMATRDAVGMIAP